MQRDWLPHQKVFVPLCDPGESFSPEWLGDLLVQREEIVTVGGAQFLDWEEVKKKIRESLS